MALMSKGTQNYKLAATIANALVHHQQAAEVGDALTHLTALANGGTGNTDESEEWLNEQIWDNQRAGRLLQSRTYLTDPQ